MADVLNKVQTRLIMTFATVVGRNVSLSVDNPKENVSEAEIKKAMETIVAQDIFCPYDSKLSSGVEAKVVVTDTIEYDLEVPGVPGA